MSIILEVARAEDLPRTIAAEWYSFESPSVPIFRLYCPVAKAGRAKAIADNVVQQQESLLSQDTDIEITWIMATLNGNIVGGAQWSFVAKDSTVEADIDSLAARHQEGGARMFATESFRSLREIAGSIREVFSGQSSYASLGTLFTTPEYRKNGIGSLLLKWGIRRADEKNMDIWIEAAPEAAPFYESHGFIEQRALHLSPRRPATMTERDKLEWDSSANLLLPITTIIMCRVVENR